MFPHLIAELTSFGKTYWTNKRRGCSVTGMHEGRKRVLGIIAGILVARHLKTTDHLFDTRDSPRTTSMVAAAVQWAEKDHEDNVTADDKARDPESL
jgi:hypothetical protein